jgi:hypothetical protein
MESKKTTKEKQKRVNLAKEFGLSMSLSRVRALIQRTVNSTSLSQEIKQLKERLAYIDNGKAPKDELSSEADLENKLKKLQDELIRLQALTPMAMTALINYLLRDALVTTFDYCLKLEKQVTLVKACHMYSALVNKSASNALFTLSQAFENKIYKDKDAKKETNPELSSKEKKKASKQGFKTYIGHLIDDIKESVKDPSGKAKYSGIRVSSLLKEALDMFTRDIVKILSEISANLCDIDDVRTITWNHLHRALDSQMIARHVAKKDYAPLIEFVQSKVDAYKNYKDKEKYSKMTTEQKKDYESKKLMAKGGKVKLTPEQKKEQDRKKDEESRLEKRRKRQVKNKNDAAKKIEAEKEKAKKDTEKAPHVNGTSEAPKTTEAVKKS